jgi:glycosyltransferase involved in cell wall biosynthesis
LNIVHAGAFKIGTVHGTFNAMWTLARGQVARGHDVAIVRMGKEATREQQELAERNGVRLVGFPSSQWGRFWKAGDYDDLLGELRPDVVHLSYVRVPRYVGLSQALIKRGIPYVVSLHGGMNSIEMTRKRVRKRVYWHALEKRIHRNASGLHFLTERERTDYYNAFGVRHAADSVVPNAVPVPEDLGQWPGIRDPAAPRLAYFGRYDPWHKGIDLAAKLVRELRKGGLRAELHLVGSVDLFEKQMELLKDEYSDVPIVDHGFMSGTAMYRAMLEFDLYIQYSRFEAFGMSLVEAMGLGVPAIVSEACDLAPELGARDAAIQVSMDPKAAARVVADKLDDPVLLVEMAKRGREWATEECSPTSTSDRVIDMYQRTLGHPSE